MRWLFRKDEKVKGKTDEKIKVKAEVQNWASLEDKFVSKQPPPLPEIAQCPECGSPVDTRYHYVQAQQVLDTFLCQRSLTYTLAGKPIQSYSCNECQNTPAAKDQFRKRYRLWEELHAVVENSDFENKRHALEALDRSGWGKDAYWVKSLPAWFVQEREVKDVELSDSVAHVLNSRKESKWGNKFTPQE